jgi:hypothetical protein
VAECDDVSWEGQNYAYNDKGYALKERWDGLTYNGCEFLSFDIALLQMGESEVHAAVYEVLRDATLAKRIGFKKIFVEQILRGDASRYDEIIEDFTERVGDLDRFDGYDMNIALHATLKEFGRETPGVFTYPLLSHAVFDKLSKLKLEAEKLLIVESRAFLISYDDFIFGLKMNQGINEELQRKIAELQFAFDKKVAQLRAAAERVGLLAALDAALDAELQQFAQPEDVLEIDSAIVADEAN